MNIPKSFVIFVTFNALLYKFRQLYSFVLMLELDLISYMLFLVIGLLYVWNYPDNSLSLERDPNLPAC